MRDLMIFLGSNTMAILVLTSKPSIKNKFIFYRNFKIHVKFFVKVLIIRSEGGSINLMGP